MRDVIKLYNECVRDMQNIGIDVPVHKIKRVYINTRLSRAYGKCYKKASNFEIAIIPCVMDENVPSHVCRSIMSHEVLHTVDGCFNHGKKFQNYCNLIEDCLGIKMGTYVDKGYMEEIKSNTEVPQRRRLEVNWEFMCENINCSHYGHVWKYKKMPKFMAYGFNANTMTANSGSCPYCHKNITITRWTDTLEKLPMTY